MVTILLQQILDLLTGWLESFTTWANDMGDKVAAIKTNTDNIPGIKADTADIKDNTAAVITPIGAINSNVSAIASDVGSIKADTTVIKNNAGSIATSSGLTAAYTEDIADNTLDCKNRLVTIGSDTTQIRTDSDSIAADVTEIKNTLGLYLYNTIVTEDSEGSIANFDTDLKDYLQEAKVIIPADLTGYSGITLTKMGANLCPSLTGDNTNGLTTTVSADGTIHVSGIATGTGGIITTYINFPFTLKSGTQITASITNVLNTNLRMVFNNGVIDIPANAKNRSATLSHDVTSGRLYLFTTANQSYDLTFKFQLELGSTATSYEPYKAMTYPVTFGSTITDGAEVDLLSGIVKINTSPVSYDSITPLAIRTFKGVNNIYSDIGDMSVTYRETLKHYLEKQDSNSRSLNRNVNLLRENIESTEDSDRREI